MMRGLSLAGLWLSSTSACCSGTSFRRRHGDAVCAARMAGIIPNKIEGFGLGRWQP